MARPRVLISTDIGGSDNDDAQSLIHAMLYADKLDYKGFVVTRSDDGGKLYGKPTDGTKMVREIIDAYGKDLGNLKSHSAAFPSAESLAAKVRAGAHDGKFPGALSPGAQLIIDEGRKASPGDPLYVLTWGPIHDAAAAILKAPDIVPNVRLISIAGLGQDRDQPQAYNGLRNAVAKDADYKKLWWVDIGSTLFGMYATEKGATHAGIKANLPWVEDNIKGKGVLGDLFWRKYTFNMTNKPNPKDGHDGLKMGDTPSLLYLIDNVNDDNPGLSSWGGRFQKDKIGPNIWVDSTAPGDKLGDKVGAKTVYQHREAIFDDFAERLGWADKAKAGGKAPAPAPEPAPAPQPPAAKPPVEPDEDDAIVLDGGRVVLDAQRMSSDAVMVIEALDFDAGDRIAFHNYEEDTFKAAWGGNPLSVNRAGTFAKLQSLVDIQELVGMSSGVTATVDTRSDQLTLHIESGSGSHDLVLAGLARDYAATYDDTLF